VVVLQAVVAEVETVKVAVEIETGDLQESDWIRYRKIMRATATLLSLFFVGNDCGSDQCEQEN
jgi:hypothetical protein